MWRRLLIGALMLVLPAKAVKLRFFFSVFCFLVSCVLLILFQQDEIVVLYNVLQFYLISEYLGFYFDNYILFHDIGSYFVYVYDAIDLWDTVVSMPSV